MTKKTVLVVASHPDDEILGCGGTMAKLAQQGANVYTLILGEGVTSRDEKRDRTKNVDKLSELKAQCAEANKIVGVKETFMCDFPDNRFDTVALLDIVKRIEQMKEKVAPDVIFTHHANDLNVDHKITYEAVLTATRPMKGERVKEVYSFEVLSSTEWRYPLSFSPDVFIDIETFVDKKCKAMAVYTSELKRYPHPRSIKGIELNAQCWGMKVGLNAAEVFKTVRAIK